MHELIHDFIPLICSWPLRLEREMFFERRSLVERGGRRDFVRDKGLDTRTKEQENKGEKGKKENILLKLTFAPLRECCSIRSGASGQPYYCTPLLCVSDAIELLVVWRHNKPKSQKNAKVNKKSITRSFQQTFTTDLGLSIHLSVFELRETGDWDIFLRPPEQARAQIGGADQWMLKRREFPGFARVNKATSASLGYPLSVLN